MKSTMKHFELHRYDDETGTSGRGVVAAGVMWPDGHCVMRWLTEITSVTHFDRPEDIEKIHGHGGKTKLVWTATVPISDELKPQPSSAAVSFRVVYAHNVRDACRTEGVPHDIDKMICSFCYEASTIHLALNCEYRDSTWLLWWTDAEACTRRVVHLDERGKVLFDIQPPKTERSY